MSHDDPGVIWRGERPDLTLPQLAALFAPVLWFSPDEPLIRDEEQISFPHVHPCDVETDSAVVYYQVGKLMLESSEKVTNPPEEDPQFFEKVRSFTLRYYFYYRKDYGFGSHDHDVELVEFEVFLDKTDNGCYQVRLEQVTAFAHGVDWYNNTMIVDENVRYPITFFVEEGKHASCPDKNADGIYTPGYDVNKRVNDAWGVRDILATGNIISSSYQASMTKPRDPYFKVLPPEVNLPCVHPWFNSTRTDTGEVRRYQLRRANLISGCEDIPVDRERLLGMMKKHRFGSEYEPRQSRIEILHKLTDPLPQTKWIVSSISLRHDRAFGFGLTFRGKDFGYGYLVPKMNFAIRDDWKFKDISFEGMLTRSASRFFDWYATAGAAFETDRFVDDNGNIKLAEDRNWHFVSELGVKFRFRVSGKARIATLGYDFAGVRFGLRQTGFNYHSATRIIIEIGPGVW